MIRLTHWLKRTHTLCLYQHWSWRAYSVGLWFLCAPETNVSRVSELDPWDINFLFYFRKVESWFRIRLRSTGLDVFFFVSVNTIISIFPFKNISGVMPCLKSLSETNLSKMNFTRCPLDITFYGNGCSIVNWTHLRKMDTS